MPFYMTQFSYTPEAWAALSQNPEDRSAAVREAAESMGGRIFSSPTALVSTMDCSSVNILTRPLLLPLLWSV